MKIKKILILLIFILLVSGCQKQKESSKDEDKLPVTNVKIELQDFEKENILFSEMTFYQKNKKCILEGKVVNSNENRKLVDNVYINLYYLGQISLSFSGMIGKELQKSQEEKFKFESICGNLQYDQIKVDFSILNI